MMTRPSLIDVARKMFWHESSVITKRVFVSLMNASFDNADRSGKLGTVLDAAAYMSLNFHLWVAERDRRSWPRSMA